jgi:hypothetical protein
VAVGRAYATRTTPHTGRGARDAIPSGIRTCVAELPCWEARCWASSIAGIRARITPGGLDAAAASPRIRPSGSRPAILMRFQGPEIFWGIYRQEPLHSRSEKRRVPSPGPGNGTRAAGLAAAGAFPRRADGSYRGASLPRRSTRPGRVMVTVRESGIWPCAPGCAAVGVAARVPARAHTPAAGYPRGDRSGRRRSSARSPHEHRSRRSARPRP